MRLEGVGCCSAHCKKVLYGVWINHDKLEADACFFPPLYMTVEMVNHDPYFAVVLLVQGSIAVVLSTKEN